MTAAKRNRYGHRQVTMIRLAFHDRLPACELVDLERSQVDFTAARLHVRGAKKGTKSTYPLCGAEMRALGSLRRKRGRHRSCL
jgi:integrase